MLKDIVKCISYDVGGWVGMGVSQCIVRWYDLDPTPPHSYQIPIPGSLLGLLALLSHPRCILQSAQSGVYMAKELSELFLFFSCFVNCLLWYFWGFWLCQNGELMIPDGFQYFWDDFWNFYFAPNLDLFTSFFMQKCFNKFKKVWQHL